MSLISNMPTRLRTYGFFEIEAQKMPLWLIYPKTFEKFTVKKSMKIKVFFKV